MNKISGLNPVQINKGTKSILTKADNKVFNQLEAVMRADDNKVMSKLDQVGKHLDKSAAYTEPEKGSLMRALKGAGKGALISGGLGAGLGGLSGFIRQDDTAGPRAGLYGLIGGGLGGVMGGIRGFKDESPEDYFLRLALTNRDEAAELHTHYLMNKYRPNMKITNQHPQVNFVKDMFDRASVS